jgi:hypothetical protein
MYVGIHIISSLRQRSTQPAPCMYDCLLCLSLEDHWQRLMQQTHKGWRHYCSCATITFLMVAACIGTPTPGNNPGNALWQCGSSTTTSGDNGTCTATCNSGFRGVPRPPSATCTKGNWSQVTGSCEPNRKWAQYTVLHALLLLCHVRTRLNIFICIHECVYVLSVVVIIQHYTTVVAIFSYDQRLHTTNKIVASDDACWVMMLASSLWVISMHHVEGHQHASCRGSTCSR